MNILLTNDDGSHAAGLAALAQACSCLGHSITIVAPAVEQSQCGHRVTTHQPLDLLKLDAQRYTVSGTPADCVRVALFGLDLRPDLVISGINHGGNMGQDIHISGTCAAAREATYHGLRAIAVSHYIVRDLAFDWERMAQWMAQLLPEVLNLPHEADNWTNINFPHLPAGPLMLPKWLTTSPERSPLGVAFESTAAHPERTSYQYAARYSDRPHNGQSDVAVTFGGHISVSQLRL